MNSHARFPSTWQVEPSWVDPEELAPSIHEPVPGDPLRSAMAGGAAGFLCGIMALGVMGAVNDRVRLVEQARVAFGSASTLPGVTLESVWMRVGIAAIAGMFVGTALGVLTRRLHGRFARAVFGAVLVPSLWIALDAFALVRFAPRLAAFVPFVPGLVAALVFGVCVALVRPVLPRWVRFQAKPSPNGTASFLLVRRRF